MISGDKQGRIREGYDKGMTINEIARYAGVTRETVCRYLEKWGLEPHGYVTRKMINKIQRARRQGMSAEETAAMLHVHKEVVVRYSHEPIGRRISEIQVERILEAHELGMTEDEAAEYAGVGEGSVRRVWKDHGLRPHYPLRISEEQRNEIINAYNSGMTIRQIEELVGVSYSTVRKYLEKANVQIHREGKFISDDQKKKIYEAHNLGMTIERIAEYAGVGKATVSRYLKLAGLTAGPKPQLTEEEKNKIIQCYTDGIPVDEIANETKRSTSTIYRCLREHGIELRKKNKQKEN